METYVIPGDWAVEFPDDWVYETDEEQHVFYPGGSGLTVRITPFIAEKEGIPAPAEVMETVFRKVVPEGAEPLPGGIAAYKSVETERDEAVYRVTAGFPSEGKLLTANIFGTSEEECLKALGYLENIKEL